MEAESTLPPLHAAAPPLVLENGEATLALDPAHGGRWITWDLALAGGPPQRLLSAPGATIRAGRALLVAAGNTPEVQTALGPASPSGLGDHFLPLTTTQRDFALGTARELGTF